MIELRRPWVGVKCSGLFRQGFEEIAADVLLVGIYSTTFEEIWGESTFLRWCCNEDK